MTAVLNPSAVEHARTQVARIADTAQELCSAMDAEHAAIGLRDEYLNDQLKILIGTPNPLNNGKPHSKDSAEAVIKQSDEYRELASLRIDAEKQRLCASAAHEAQQLHAKLAVATIAHPVSSGDLH